MERYVIPPIGSDVLLHDKDTDRSERVIFPFTRYRNIINAPNVVTDDIEIDGAPFHLLKTGTVKMKESDIRDLCGDII